MNTLRKCLLSAVKTLLLCLIFIALQSTGYAQSQRVPFISAVPSQDTGQDYSPWLIDNLDSLVLEAWQNNFVYVDVTLRLKYHTRITQIKLYDYTGVFDDKPAEIYALNGTQKTLLGTFSGPGYMTFQYLNPPQPVEADAIVIHKYSNNIPQKIFAYGIPDTTRVNMPDTAGGSNPGNPIPNPQPGNPTDSLTKIPIDVSRWYQLNNVSDGLQGMFDGITDAEVNTGYGKIFNNYDAYYPVAQGERIDLKKLRFYNRTGGLGPFPLTVSVIDSTGARKVIGTYTGGYYQRWLGPNPAQPDNFMLDTAVNKIKYIVLNCWYQFPTELEFYGSYTAPQVTDPDTVLNTPAPTYAFKNYLGVNAFEWDFQDGTNPGEVESTRLEAMKTFSQIRHYMDWQKLEPNQGGYTFNPTHSGGWNYDAIYEVCRDNGIDVLADLKTLPNWLLESYPESERDQENVPVAYGADFSNPVSYIEQARVAFQFAARYGSNANVNQSLLSVNSTPRWTADPINEVKVGLNLIKYIECDNERDKWWKGRKAYQTAYEYAANLSAFYDGHKNTMGPGVGVKNADSNMLVVMGGLAAANTEYVKGMVEWCKLNRGYKADGTVNLCWDIINYHWYSHDAQMIPNSYPTRGTAPEVGNTYQKALDFIETAKSYAGGMPVWVTEAGYDANPYSPIRAIPIGNKTILQTQADWILRTALLYARAGVAKVFMYQAYDDNFHNPIQYGSSGLLNTDRTRKPAADYLLQVKNLLGDYHYKQTLNADPMVDSYEFEGKQAYALFIPDETGRTANYELELPDADSAEIYTPAIGAVVMTKSKVKVNDGKLALNVTETPIFVLPVSQQIPASLMSKSPIGLKRPVTDTATFAPALSIYPNPSSNYVNISFSNTNFKQVNITITDAAAGRTYGNYLFNKPGEVFSETIDISRMPEGTCLLMIKQGDKTIVRKVIKTR